MRDAAIENDDFEWWNTEVVPLLSYCESESHIHYDSKEYIATVNNAINKQFIRHGESYTYTNNYISVTGLSPSVTVIMNGTDVTENSCSVNNDGHFENAYIISVNIPHVNGNININYS